MTVGKYKGISNGVCDALFLTIPSILSTFILIYRPPLATKEAFNDTLCEAQNFIDSLPNNYSNFIIGDFNFPIDFMKWPDPTSHIDKREVGSDKHGSGILQNFAIQNFLVQKIAEPTRGNNILDLLFTSNPDAIVSIQIKNLPLSDHRSILINTSMRKSKQQEQIKVNELPAISTFDFSKANWDDLRAALESSNINDMGEIKDIEQMLDKITDLIITCCERANVPLKKIPQKCMEIPKRRRRKFRKRARLLKKLKDSNGMKRTNLLIKIEELDKEIKESIGEERRGDEVKAVEQIKTNAKFFYHFAQKRANVGSKIPQLTKPNGSICNSNDEIAKELSDQYRQAFSKPMTCFKISNPQEFFVDSFSTDDFVQNFDFIPLTNINFNEQDVENVFKQFKEGAAAGPDGFPSIMLKQCSKQLAPAFCKLFNVSFNTGQVPKSFKLAKIVPIHKGGDKKVPKNYRPVALTSHLSKAMEKIIRKQIISYLENNCLIDPNQHGFRRGHSTLSQLLSHTEEIIERIEDDSTVDVLYLDFAKAFDKVDHGVLMSECKKLGISGKLGLWMHTFLTERKQFVHANGANSDEVQVMSGVPQGTVLAANLFLVLINSLKDVLKFGTSSSYADDTKIVHKISTTKDITDLQSDLESIYKWAQENNMEFNSGKFQLLRYGKTAVLSNISPYLAPNQEEITEQNAIKDLGIWMSNDGSFSDHINCTILSGVRIAGYIFRTFDTREASPMKTLFKSLILSKFDYCSALIHPTINQSMSGRIERVQREFTRRIDGMKELNYWERLNTLKLYSMERRRERFVIIYTYKILINQVPNPGISFKSNKRTGIRAVVPQMTNNMTSLQKKLRVNSFVYSGSRLFNCLPMDLRNFTTESNSPVNSFKNLLDQFLFTIPDQPTVSGLQRAADSNSIIDQVNYCTGPVLPVLS